MKIKPFIYSFPRSGLHLTAAVIGLPVLMKMHKMEDPEFVRYQIDNNDSEILFFHKTRLALADELFDYIQNNTKPILVVRDPKDALFSWYAMANLGTENKAKMWRFVFSEANYHISPRKYETKVAMWKEHINDWLACLNDPLILRFENFINSYNVESKKIADYLEIEVKPEIPSLSDCKLSRTGLIGDGERYFDKELCDLIDNMCKDEIKLIDEYLL